MISVRLSDFIAGIHDVGFARRKACLAALILVEDVEGFVGAIPEADRDENATGLLEGCEAVRDLVTYALQPGIPLSRLTGRTLRSGQPISLSPGIPAGPAGRSWDEPKGTSAS